MEDNKKSSACPVSRWSLLKQYLSNLPPEAFLDAARKDPEAVLLDVRTPQEAVGETLLDAINMDYLGEKFLDQLESLDPKGHYLVFCRSGRRSMRVCTLMRNAGFENVHHLDGGLNALNIWKDQPSETTPSS